MIAPPTACGDDSCTDQEVRVIGSLLDLAVARKSPFSEQPPSPEGAAHSAVPEHGGSAETTCRFPSLYWHSALGAVNDRAASAGLGHNLIAGPEHGASFSRYKA